MNKRTTYNSGEGLGGNSIDSWKRSSGAAKVVVNTFGGIKAVHV